MLKVKRIITFLLTLILLFSSSAFAASHITNDTMDVGSPKITVSGTTATCSCKVTFAGKNIDATMELWQGSNFIASWNETGYGSVSFSETMGITRGLTYTLTVFGTANGVNFTPKSVTKVL